jgi:hypothetical protein
LSAWHQSKRRKFLTLPSACPFFATHDKKRCPSKCQQKKSAKKCLAVNKKKVQKSALPPPKKKVQKVQGCPPPKKKKIPAQKGVSRPAVLDQSGKKNQWKRLSPALQKK